MSATSEQAEEAERMAKARGLEAQVRALTEQLTKTNEYHAAKVTPHLLKAFLRQIIDF